jgi:hypothetical protein
VRDAAGTAAGESIDAGGLVTGARPVVDASEAASGLPENLPAPRGCGPAARIADPTAALW